MSQSDRWTESIINNRRPMEMMPTDIAPKLSLLSGIRAVVFDVYGTLVISGSGDVGSADPTGRDSRVDETIAAVGINVTPTLSVADLHQQIIRMNDGLRSEACPKPEVDIVEAWRRTLQNRDIWPTTQNAVQLAAEYESRANPTWPMPGARDLLSLLNRSDMSLGIVSNAQVFTVPLVKDLLIEKSLAAGGFDLDLSVFSNRFRQAKPGPRLFDVLCDGLARRGIEPFQAIYVGNDMLNDIWAASRAGLKTAWFAGDARSCRRREDDPRCQSLEPDVVLTELMQLPECLELK